MHTCQKYLLHHSYLDLIFMLQMPQIPRPALVSTGLGGKVRLGFPHSMHARCLHEIIDAILMHITSRLIAPTRNGVYDYVSDMLASSDIFC